MSETNEWTRETPWIDRPDADIDLFLSKYEEPVSFDLREKLLSWRENGYVVFEQAASPALIDDFTAEVDHIRENFQKYVIPIEIRGKQTWSKAVSPDVIRDPGVKFNHLHTSSLYGARLSLLPAVMEFLNAIFLAPPVPTQSLTFWMGSQQATHIDYPYVCAQRRLAFMAASWVALEDVDPDAGPLAYFPGAHRPGVCGFFDWGKGDILSRPETKTQTAVDFARYLDDKLEQAGIKPKVFCPRKGDVLIWHGAMPHTGTPVRRFDLTRKSYVTHYTSLADYPERWLESGENSDPEFIAESGGFVFDFPWSSPDSKLPSWRANFPDRR